MSLFPYFEAKDGAAGGLAGMTTSASLNAGCGTYSYAVDSDVRFCKVEESSLKGVGEFVPLDFDLAKAGIKWFCACDYTADPATPQPPSGFSQDATQDEYPYQVCRNPDDGSDHATQVFVAFAPTPTAVCNEPLTFNIKEDPAECERLFNKVLADPGPCKYLSVLTFSARE